MAESLLEVDSNPEISSGVNNLIVAQSKAENNFWNLASQGRNLEPLIFSNGKTQEDVVEEVVSLIKEGKKIILLHGMCGTGKSAIALNIARVLGKTALVVPVKALQRQYEEDYVTKKWVTKANNERLSIAMITGRANHHSLFKQGASCADPFLPETIAFAEKNAALLQQYYNDNPLIKHKHNYINIKRLRRISIAPSNPYWSPILPAFYEFSQFTDAKKHRYQGLSGKEFIFYHRKEGCAYYDQYLSYLSADVVLFNAAKYKIEVALDRKPETYVDIIDEADEFLDNFSIQEELNLTRLRSALQHLSPEQTFVSDTIQNISELLVLEEKNKQALGIDEQELFPLQETKLEKILKLFLNQPELAVEIILDEESYANRALVVADSFEQLFGETYVSYRKVDKELIVQFVSTNLSKRFGEIVSKNKALVLMSGTLHSKIVLQTIFGIKDFALVEAETMLQGNLEIRETGKEIDCKYEHFRLGKHTREEYLRALEACAAQAIKPVVVHVQAYEDLPSEGEIIKYGLQGLMGRDELRRLQFEDKTGKRVSLFKSKASDVLFSTNCARGVDFPGDICNSMIFTKYPNPAAQDIFWRLLRKTHPASYWSFYHDKAHREFLQRLFRALRSKEDHVYVLSPDIRVLDAARAVQKKMQEGKSIE